MMGLIADVNPLGGGCDASHSSTIARKCARFVVVCVVDEDILRLYVVLCGIVLIV